MVEGMNKLDFERLSTQKEGVEYSFWDIVQAKIDELRIG